MFTEHLIWTAALAVFVGFFYKKSTGRDPWWIMIIATVLPDSDYILQCIGIYIFGYNSYPIYHTEFHNLFMCIVFSTIFAYLLMKYLKVPFKDGFIYTFIGFGAHIIEDMMVYPVGEHPLAPFNWVGVGLNVFPHYTPYHYLFDPEVMTIGLIILVGICLIRIGLEGTDWLTDVKELVRTHFL